MSLWSSLGLLSLLRGLGGTWAAQWPCLSLPPWTWQWAPPRQPPSPPLSPPCRKVEDLQFRVEEESITKGDLEVTLGQGPAPALAHGCGIQRDSLGGSWEDDQREKWGKVKGHILECERGRASLEQFSWGVRAGIGSTPGTPGGCMGRQVQGRMDPSL